MPTWMAAFARHVEACGFESIVAVEHTVLMTRYDSVYPYDESGGSSSPPTAPCPIPLTCLRFWPARPRNSGLATGVLVLPNHHPVVLAKRVATIDALSGGRVRLAVGMGWMKEEIEACGVAVRQPRPPADEQIDGHARCCGKTGPRARAITASSSTSTTPLVIPSRGTARIPIHIGGHSRAAARRAGRLGDGFQPLGVGGPN